MIKKRSGNVHLFTEKEPYRCVVCDARNYGEEDPVRGKRVDVLYKLIVGPKALHLCPDCLKAVQSVTIGI